LPVRTNGQVVRLNDLPSRANRQVSALDDLPVQADEQVIEGNDLPVQANDLVVHIIRQVVEGTNLSVRTNRQVRHAADLPVQPNRQVGEGDWYTMIERKQGPAGTESQVWQIQPAWLHIRQGNDSDEYHRFGSGRRRMRRPQDMRFTSYVGRRKLL